MEDARDLAGLRGAVSLIGDEHFLEGWAARAAQTGGPVLGLILVTDERLIFVDTGAGMMAFPISKISSTEVISPCEVTFTAWYGRLALTFDNPGILSSMLNLVRQDPAWNAVETGLSRPYHRLVGVSLAQASDVRPLQADTDPLRATDLGYALIEPLEAA